MINALFVLLLLAVPVFGAGTLYPHRDTVLKNEFENIYQYINHLDVADVGVPGGTGIAISKVSASSSHVLWETMTLQNADGKVVTFSSTSVSNGGILTMDTGTSGAFGLDTGVIQSSTFYFIHGISDGDRISAVYSLNATSPTLPSGYSYWAPLGAWKTDGSADLVDGIQIGDTFEFAPQNIIYATNGTGGSFTEIDISTHIPNQNSVWEVEIYGWLQGTWSDTGPKNTYLSLRTGFKASSEAILFDDLGYQSSGNIRTAGSRWIFTTEDDPQHIEAFWTTTSANRTASLLYLYINRYKVRFNVR